MKSKRVVILGGIGNGSVIASAIEDANRRGDEEWVFAGYLNDREEKGAEIQGCPVLGAVDDAARLAREGYFILNTIYRIDGQKERIDMFDSLGLDDDQLVRFVHPTAYVAPDIEVGPGVVIMPNVSVSPAATFQKGCLIMVSATIGHDTHFGKHCHVAAQACVGAYLRIEEGVHIGLNATIREELTIGRNATIGMGSVLTKSVGESEIWAGNPARFLRLAK